MSLLFPLTGTLFLIALAVRVLVLISFVDAITHPDSAYLANGKQTKIFWLVVLGVGLLFALVGLIASLVYLLDVRPALRASRGGRGGGSSSDGPYGPYRR